MSDVVLAHKHSANHRHEILASHTCGCFYCLKVFGPLLIKEWIDVPEEASPGCSADEGTTAMCPYCGIDSVIGDRSGYPIDREFLSRMRRYWFAGSL